MTVKIFKGNDHNVRKQIGEELTAITSAAIITGSATTALPGELVLTAGTNVAVTIGASTATVSAGYPIFVQGLEIATPVNGNVHYFGQYPRVPDLAPSISRVYIPKNGTIKIADISAYMTGSGTNETWTLAIRLNNTTDTTIATVGSNGSLIRFTNTALSIAVTTADFFEIKATFPTWATPPTGMIFAGVVYVE